jgi:hypothetical protein
MLYLLLSFLKYSKPALPSIAKARKYEMVFTYSMMQAQFRVPFCSLVELGESAGNKVREHCYISLLPLPLHYLLYRCSTNANI